jgi:hypothetical protein
MAVTQILLAIYEVDFLPCSNGYRPGLGAHDAIRTLTRELQFGGHHYLHYALDLWFERVVRPQQRGRCRMDKETPSPEAKPDAQDAQPPVSALPDTATADYGKVQCRNALPAGIKFLPTVVELSATDG